MERFIAEWWFLITGGLVILAVAVWLGLTDRRNENARSGVMASWSVVVGLAAAPFVIVGVGTANADVLWELYAVFLGAIVLLAFFQPNRAFVLRGFQRVSETLFFPPSKLWLLALGALFVGTGLYGLARRFAV